MMAAETLTPAPIGRRRWSRSFGILAAILLLLWLLLVSGTPAVPAHAGPTPELAGAGRQLLVEIARAQERGSAAAPIRLDGRTVGGLAVLASHAAGIEHAKATIEGDRLVAAASLPLPASQWINASLGVSGRHTGFPTLDLRVGRVALPQWASRASAEFGRWLLRLKGIEVPPLDELVSSVAVSDGRLEARLKLPGRGGLADAVTRLRGGNVDPRAVRLIYCRLAALQRAGAADLHALVRNAFASPSHADAARNRAAFVALAMATVGDRADNLSPAGAGARRACGSAPAPVLLAGRADLAKHWALSAALTALFGADAAGAMGEWKELSDSRPSQSGFSFVDLAADRSAVQTARAAVDPETARAAAHRLARASEESMLPIRLLAAQEGLSEQQFLGRFRSIDSSKYDQVVARIDRELARSSRSGGAP